MYTLYLDTHSNKIIIVLYNNDQILIKQEQNTSYDHSISTMPLLIKTLEQHNLKAEDLNQIVVVNGPGSFTGVRIGVTIAKTLAYTLNVPIKTVSSLFIKAVSFDHEEVTIVEREKNGVFLGKFDKNNNLIEDYQYLKNMEYESLTNKQNFVENIALDYERIKKLLEALKSQNPHSVKPLYVKKIEVEK